MKYLYWCDMDDTMEEERKLIEDELKQIVSNKIEVEAMDIPPFNDNKYFDVLFFDWGGMSIGNSLLEHFCFEIFKHAQEHPNKIYVMTSMMTKAAMKDCQSELEHENEKLNNLFLDIENALPLIKEWENS